MQDQSPLPGEPTEYQCPACNQVVAAGGSGAGILQCPHCGRQFFAASEDADRGTGESETEDPSQAQSADESEISEVRIREAMHTRQAIYRRRRWPVMAAAACLMAAAKLIQMAIVGLLNGTRLVPAGDLLAAVIALVLGAHFVQRAIGITRQIRALQPPQPAAPPDFSTLSDGSQQWKSLQEMADPEADAHHTSDK